jgi:hypothetical protein
MSPTFGTRSRNHLATCHADLVLLCDTVIRYVDFSVIDGWRSPERQNEAVVKKRSKLLWPKGNHNAMRFPGGPMLDQEQLGRVARREDGTYALDGESVVGCSLAIDFTPYPFHGWNDAGAFLMIVGAFRVVALQLGLAARFGADWDSDWQTTDQTFHDLGHVELRPQ